MADLHSNVTEEELAALADGTLDPERRATVEAAVAASPRLAAILAVQRSVVDAVGAANAQIQAPQQLRERIAAAAARPAKRPRRRAGWLAALGAVAAATIGVLVLGSRGGEGPTVLAAARIASEPANAAPPAPAGARQLDLTVEGVQFPDFADRFGWRAVGTRQASVAGRPMTTVVYENAERRVSYAVVTGGRLATPNARSVTVEGTRLLVFRDDERTVVTWERRGHTCVMVATGVSESTLTELAGWKGRGAIAF